MKKINYKNIKLVRTLKVEFECGAFGWFTRIITAPVEKIKKQQLYNYEHCSYYIDSILK